VETEVVTHASGTESDDPDSDDDSHSFDEFLEAAVALQVRK
jgi:hypothetical protein